MANELLRSRFKTCFRRENVQFCRLARSEGGGIFGEYVWSERRSRSQQKLGF